MPSQAEWYRLLQQHLDSQPVGFPAAPSGADLQLLERLFTLEEAQVALHLSFRPTPLAEIAERTAPTFTAEQTERLLEGLEQKGAISWKQRGGVDHWHLMPLLVGIYEWVKLGGKVSEFDPAAEAYMGTQDFHRALLSARPSQVRTIPIGESIPVEHAVAPYDEIRTLVRAAPGPFVVLPCVCRESKAQEGKPCQKTSRTETCLALDDLATAMLRRQVGREVTRDELLELLRQSEKEGLVLQPTNTQRPGFICVCCGCCCGLLLMQKQLSRPVDFWASNYHAVANDGTCSSCGSCLVRCQVNALSLPAPTGTVRVDLARCIGCGLCVPTCPSQTLLLEAKRPATVPPTDELDLYEEILRNRMVVKNQGARECHQ